MDEQLRRELSDINSGLAELRTNMKAAFHRIDEQKAMADSVHKLALSVERLTHELREQRKDHEDVLQVIAVMQKEIDAIKAEPANKWKALTGDIIKVVAAAMVGAVIAKFGIQ